MGDRKGLLKALGPGFLFAAVSVGVSHLVQSTRAGASFGFTLLPLALVVLFLKYPLFEFGQRYAAATGRSLLDGYRKQGRWTLVFYLVLTVGAMFTVLAAVAVITAGLAIQLTGIDWPTTLWSAILIATAAAILVVGRYPLLDKAIKVIMAVLAVSTVAATIAVLPKLAGMTLFGSVSLLDLTFVVAFVGWMPTGMDVSVWQSFWSLARRRQTGYAPTLKETLFDFRLGYIGTGILAVMFLTLGTALMFGKENFPNSAPAFAAAVIDLYVQSLGEWSRPIIAIAAFTTMFSTLLTVMDGFPRALWLLVRRFRSAETEDEFQMRAGRSWVYLGWMTALAGGGMLIICFCLESLTDLVDLATILSFCTAPFLGILSYRAVTATWFPEEYRPGKKLRALALAAILFLGAFLLLFVYVRFLMPD